MIITRHKTSFPVSFYELTLLFVGIVSAVSMLLLCIKQFTVPHSLYLGLALSLCVSLYFRVTPTFFDSRFNGWFLVLLLIAIVLRLDLYTHFIGGVDQGLYVNMSETFIRDHGLSFVDHFRASLPNDLINSYDKAGMSGSIRIIDSVKSIYKVLFYPLHPAWMAIFKHIFGLGRHTLSVFFFSILSLIGTYLLTLEISNKNKFPALLTLLFCALNPALVFFSKSPATEVVALAFSINGFYMLIKGLRSCVARERVFYIFVSLLLFNSFLYIRMSFFIFVPLFSVIYLLSYTLFVSNDTGILIRRFLSCLALLSIFSMGFYFFFQNELFCSLFSVSMPIFRRQSIVFVTTGFILISLFFIYTIFLRKNIKNKLSSLLNILYPLIPWLFFIVIVLSALSLIKLFYADNIPMLFNRVIPVDKFAFRLHAIYIYFLMISPIGLIILVGIPFFRLKFSGIVTLLLFFSATAWLIILQWSCYYPSLYYFGRYLVSEMVPYSLVLLAIILSEIIYKGRFWRVFGNLSICLIVLYYFVFSVCQIGKKECEDPSFFYEINNIVDKKDVIMAVKEELDNKVSMPLRCYFNKQLFIFNCKLVDLQDRFYKEIAELLSQSGNKYGRIFFLTQKEVLNSCFDGYFVKKINFEIGYFTNTESKRSSRKSFSFPEMRSFLLPMQHIKSSKPFYLYLITGFSRSNLLIGDKNNFVVRNSINFSEEGGSKLFIENGWSSQEKKYRWTDGDKAVILAKIINRRNLSSGIKLCFTAHAYTGGIKEQRIIVNINKVEVDKLSIGGYRSVEINIPPGIIDESGIVEIEFKLPDSYSPKSVGRSNDSRQLGIALRELFFREMF